MQEEACRKDGVSKPTPARLDSALDREHDNGADDPGEGIPLPEYSEPSPVPPGVSSASPDPDVAEDHGCYEVIHLRLNRP